MDHIRSEAVAGLGVLQAESSQDAVMNEYMRLMEVDQKKYVRYVEMKGKRREREMEKYSALQQPLMI
jgi:hypothetical protein